MPFDFRQSTSKIVKWFKKIFLINAHCVIKQILCFKETIKEDCYNYVLRYSILQLKKYDKFYPCF
jgi:hypothetical protein